MGLKVQISMHWLVSLSPLCIAYPSPKTHRSTEHRSTGVGEGVETRCFDGLEVTGVDVTGVDVTGVVDGFGLQRPHSKSKRTNGANAHI